MTAYFAYLFIRSALKRFQAADKEAMLRELIDKGCDDIPVIQLMTAAIERRERKNKRPHLRLISGGVK